MTKQLAAALIWREIYIDEVEIFLISQWVISSVDQNATQTLDRLNFKF